mmetsp:Transcript_1383/g.4008  ORF Transcript_1383/g.4008 Transcript_1383/m.4008 type:complete len:93 (-) Transcript_1383:67-345(-)
MGYIHAERGDLDKADACCTWANDIFERLGTSATFHGAMFKTGLSYVKFRLGDMSAAGELKQEAAVLAKWNPPLMSLASQDYYHEMCGACPLN